MMTYRRPNQALNDIGSARVVDRDFEYRWLLADYAQLGADGGAEQVSAVPCIFIGIEVVKAGAADSTVTVYDSADAGSTGTVYWDGIVNPSAGILNGLCPRKMLEGLYVVTDDGSGDAPIINILYRTLPTD